MDTVEIRGILLTKIDDHVVVSVLMPDGAYREVIRERAEGPISHCVHASGIVAAGDADAKFFTKTRTVKVI